MKTKMLMVMSLVGILSGVSLAAERQLSEGVLAEVRISGGFMAPGRSNTTVYQIDEYGTLTVTRFRGTQVTIVKKKLNNAELRTLENLISRVRKGELVDVDPTAPMGADFPSMSYYVKSGDETIQIASRRGDAHLYVLRQKAALKLKELLDSHIK